MKDLKLEESKEEKEKIENFCSGKLNDYFSAWEDLLKKNSSQEFWSGDKLTLVDLAFVLFYKDTISKGTMS